MKRLSLKDIIENVEEATRALTELVDEARGEHWDDATLEGCVFEDGEAVLDFTYNGKAYSVTINQIVDLGAPE